LIVALAGAIAPDHSPWSTSIKKRGTWLPRSVFAPNERDRQLGGLHDRIVPLKTSNVRP